MDLGLCSLSAEPHRLCGTMCSVGELYSALGRVASWVPCPGMCELRCLLSLGLKFLSVVSSASVTEEPDLKESPGCGSSAVPGAVTTGRCPCRSHDQAEKPCPNTVLGTGLLATPWVGSGQRIHVCAQNSMQRLFHAIHNCHSVARSWLPGGLVRSAEVCLGHRGGGWVPGMAHSFLPAEPLQLALNEFPPILWSWQGRE